MDAGRDDKVGVLLDTALAARSEERLRAVSPRVEVMRDAGDGAIARAHVLYTTRCKISPERLPNLRWIQLNTVAVDYVDSPLLRSGRPVANVSGAYTPAVAEFTIALLLGFWRKIPRCVKLQLERRFPGTDAEWLSLEGRNCWGTTLGLVGYGSIGRHVARIASAMGMRVLVTKRNAERRDDTKFRLDGTGDAEGTFPAAWYEIERMGEMLRQCDSVIVTLPRTNQTTMLFGRDAFAAMKPNALLVNIGRGGVVDEEALVDAVRGRRIAGAAMDVFAEEPLPADSPLWDAPNLLIAPHIGSYTDDQADLAGEVLIENVRRHLAGEPLMNVVDLNEGY